MTSPRYTVQDTPTGALLMLDGLVVAVITEIPDARDKPERVRLLVRGVNARGAGDFFSPRLLESSISSSAEIRIVGQPTPAAVLDATNIKA